MNGKRRKTGHNRKGSGGRGGLPKVEEKTIKKKGQA